MSSIPGAHLLLRSITPTNGDTLEVGTINVLVGPNNSGKSEALRDLARLVGNYDPTGVERAAGEEHSTRIIQDVTFVPKLSLDRLLRGIARDGPGKDGTVVGGLGPDLKSPYRRSVAADLKSILFRPIITARSVRTTSLGEVMPLRLAYLPPENRTKLIEPAAAASPLQTPENLLQALQSAGKDTVDRFDAAMASLCAGQHVRLDETERVNLGLRMAESVPLLTGDPVQDVLLYRALPALHEQGDGWRSCAAIILTMLVCPGRVILLDQPEAFLQPRQARKLGVWIAENAPRLGIQVFLATHDVSLVNGLFAGGADVSVFRFARRGNSTRLDLVPPDVGRGLARFPLFSAQQALRCLFSDGVILTPDESDRLIYQTVAERMLPGMNAVFLHVHGGRNLPFAARIFRRANLPTCVVAELDVFQVEQTFAELVKAISREDPPGPWLATRERLASHVEGWFDEQELSSNASEVEVFLDQLKKGTPPAARPPGPASPAPLSHAAPTPAAGPQPARPLSASARAKWDRLQREQLTVLPIELRVWVEELLEDLKRVGIFVSPKGRLQAWMPGPAMEDKEVWFNRAIQALDRNECPADLRAFVTEAITFLQPVPEAPRALFRQPD